MPKNAIRTPAYRLHKPTNQGYVRLNGRLVYLGRFDSAESRAAYDKTVAAWLSNGRQPVCDDLTVAELIVQHWDHVQTYHVKDGEPTREVGNVRTAVRPVRRLYGDTLAHDFGPAALRTVRQAFIDRGNCRRQANDQVRRIIRMFRWAVAHELVPPSVLHALKALEPLRRGKSGIRESAPVRPVADAYVDAIREHVSRQVWGMVRLQRLTGMRPNEVCTMRGRDIDTTGELWLYRPESHKTEHHGHDRVVELGPKAQAVVSGFLKADTSAYLFSPDSAEAERKAAMRAQRKTPVQPSQRDRRKRNPKRKPKARYTPDSYRRAIQRGCVKADVPTWHPHQLRHSFATMIRKKHGLETAKIMLGQTTFTAAMIYAEADRAKAREIAREVG